MTESLTKDNFSDRLFAAERRGWTFLRDRDGDSAWRIDDYDVTLTLYPEDHAIEVEGRARGTVLAPCESLRFLLGLNLAAEGGARCEIFDLALNGAPVAFEADGHRYQIPTHRPLAAGDPVTLTFHYRTVPLARKCWVNSRAQGPVPGLGDGETELCFEGYWLPFAQANFEPVTITLDVVAPSEMTVIFSGARVDPQHVPAVGDGLVDAGAVDMARHRFRAAMLGWPTLLAGDFETTVKTLSDDCRVHVYHQPGYGQAAEELADHAGEIVEHFVAWFEENPVRDFSLVQLKRTYFGQYAPFPLVAFPKDDLPLTSESVVSEKLTGMLAHEIGHFWFGGAVQSRPNEQWLSEGFAQYMNLLMMEAFYGEAALRRDLAAYAERLNELGDEPQQPLADIPLGAPNQPILVRLKGALVLHALRQVIGLDRFKALLRTLIRTYRGKTVTTADIEALCQTHIPELDVKAFFDQHLRGTDTPTWTVDTDERETSAA